MAKDDRRVVRIVVRERPGGLFEARLDGGVKPIAVSRQPFFEAARGLAAVAVAAPGTILEMVHEGSMAVALRGDLLSAARLTVAERERGLFLERWKPYQVDPTMPKKIPRQLPGGG